MKDYSTEILFQSFLYEALVSRSGMSKDVHSLTLSIQHFLCRPRRRPPSQDALKEGFGEAVVACGTRKRCKFPSLDSCRRGSCGIPRKLILLRNQSLVQAGDAEKFPQAQGFESLDPFSESAGRVHLSQPQRRMEVTRDLYSLNLLAKLMVLHRHILFSLAIAAIAEAILSRCHPCTGLLPGIWNWSPPLTSGRSC